LLIGTHVIALTAEHGLQPPFLQSHHYLHSKLAMITASLSYFTWHLFDALQVWTWPHDAEPSRSHRTIDSAPGEAAHIRPAAFSVWQSWVVVLAQQPLAAQVGQQRQLRQRLVVGQEGWQRKGWQMKQQQQ
jgi:hypothetical protein